MSQIRTDSIPRRSESPSTSPRGRRGALRHIAAFAVVFSSYLGYGLLTPWLERQRSITKAYTDVIAQQAALTSFQAVTDSINAVLADGMRRDRVLSRLRVGFLHTAPAVGNPPLLRWDITQAVTRIGHVVGPLRADLPVTDWSSFLPELLAHKCFYDASLADLPESTATRSREMLVRGFVVCPIITVRGALVGVVFGTWDDGDPDPPDPAATEAVVRGVASRIGAIIPAGS